jgi:hypothetical protein
MESARSGEQEQNHSQVDSDGQPTEVRKWGFETLNRRFVDARQVGYPTHRGLESVLGNKNPNRGKEL